VCLGGIWRLRIGVPSWSHLRPEEVEFLVRDRTGEQRPPSTVEPPGDDHDASRRYKAVPGRARPYGPDTHCIPVEANVRALHASYTALREAASWRAMGNGAHATCSQLQRPQVKEASKGLLERVF
jgi:hypothetical protein